MHLRKMVGRERKVLGGKKDGGERKKGCGGRKKDAGERKKGCWRKERWREKQGMRISLSRK